LEVIVHELIEACRADIEALCRQLGVRRLDVFGSALGDAFTEASDVDVLVDFTASSPAGPFDTYFALKEGLERILGRRVDLVTITALRNPYFIEEVMRNRENLYAA
jgi:predicted nucleotidyltransferase